jgi:penicillin-binding protein 1C
MDFVFPTKFKSKISLTKGVNNEVNPVILKVTHTNTNAILYWYLNDVFIGNTSQYHEQAIVPKQRNHKITVIDNFGNEKTRLIEIL